MKGLTPQQLVEITAFIQKHHKFSYVPEQDRINGQHGYSIKYIDACYDSRQGDYWAVSFRGFGTTTFTTNAFRFNDTATVPYTTLYDWIMAFLNYEWKAEGKVYDFMHDKDEGPLHNSLPNGILEAEWTDMDMIEAFCANLEDRNAQDTIDACDWIAQYKKRKDNKLNK